MGMRVERVIQDTEDSRVVTRLHPRTTLVHGYDGSAIRFASSVIDAVCGDPDGVHVELHLGGREITAFRPEDEPHRVVDVDGAIDVSDEFVNVAGVIDLLVPLQVSRLRAEGAMLIAPDDTIASSPRGGGVMRSLALVVAIAATAVAGLVARSTVEVAAGAGVAAVALVAWLISLRRHARSASRVDTDAIRGNIAAAQEATGVDDPLPVLVVDLFESLGSADKPAALDAVISAGEGGQVIVVTDDPEIIDLARFREMAGEVGVAEPMVMYSPVAVAP